MRGPGSASSVFCSGSHKAETKVSARAGVCQRLSYRQKRFPVALGLRSPFSCWLLAGGCSQLLEAVVRSLPAGPLHKCSHNADICSFKATGESESLSSGRSQSLSKNHLIRLDPPGQLPSESLKANCFGILIISTQFLLVCWIA